MFLSIIVATYNRRAQVLECLKETIKQARRFSDVEIIIVNNNSSDDTEEAITAYIAQSGINCKYALEKTPGGNSARNRGRELARGEVIALLDDDAIPLEGWVEKIREHFLERKSDVLAGRVELIRVVPNLPKWFPDNLHWILGKTVYGNETRSLKEGESPQSGNCAFTTEVFDSVNGFNPDSLIYGDETEFFQRVWKAEFSFVYRHDIVVDHCISVDRLSEKSLYEKANAWGEGSALNWLLQKPSPLGRVKRIVEYVLRTIYIKLRCSLSPNFARRYTYNFTYGHTKQLIKGI